MSRRPDPAPTPAPAKWLAVLPYLTLPLFLAIIAALVWLTRSADRDEQRMTLINDVLWMEQNLQFQLDRNASLLAQIGPELFAHDTHPPSTDAKLRQLLRPESGLVRVIWLDAEGRREGEMPPMSGSHLIGESVGAVPADSVFRLARAIGRRAYGPAYEVADGSHQFEVHVPIHSEDAFIGAVVGIYSLHELIARELPWWFSERYRVSVVDADGRQIVAKSKVAPLSGDLNYTIPFDPPGHGLSLHITAYRGETRWVPVLLIASTVLLAGIIVWSVWQLRRQLVRRHSAEQALRSESLFRKAMEDSLLTGLRARDLDGRITYVNPAFCRMVGYSPEELIGRLPPMPYWDPDHLERTQEVHDMILSGAAPPEGVELRLRRKNGERLDALIFEAPLIDAAGCHTGWMGSLLDITEQKRARELGRQQEERLQATSRLVTMGEMASTLAHELNQPLAAIASYNTGCLNRLEQATIDRDELRDIHAKLGRQARRAGEIIRRVHDFVRRAEPKRETLDFNTVIREAIGLIEADARKRRMRIETDLAPRLPDIPADPVMIEQVIVNLVRNGMDAMHDNPPGRRTVRVATREEGGQLVVRVADSGRGIDPDIARRLFEPFFTTKPEGMGMGLNICRSIAELHHGRLGFESNPDGGTIFILSFPVELS
ncbi:sensor histidine kinase [Aromatoleum aromaticum]|uniref:histidine kinase n=1 Tax=Aromatoleum aromaticum (strain DSM 19018 / LMG 30748 / EbN1) TaxID=76114 RepID=Q5P2I7_AROAE|nr:ATP-binding protein [Aromatoleum aromaticum]NMG55690.1 PAS domain S-box protein [Aromatoleum aromaticum]CAI08477.1 Two component sensor protein [Aromatoleum aromaticum EbN1]